MPQPVATGFPILEERFTPAVNHFTVSGKQDEHPMSRAPACADGTPLKKAAFQRFRNFFRGPGRVAWHLQKVTTWSRSKAFAWFLAC